ncbi:MAG: maleylpyruvate isomerase N-terminal domain-containing protein [Bacteroidia bacterium]|nr:maleylpyruvate isomerase N-terminal domain-containing protein [Bacteroidia bacterium]
MTLSLFPEIDRLLIELLRSLLPEDWEKQTLAPQWKIKDVAAHLLDGNIRGISSSRDKYFGESPGEIHSYADLVSFLNRLNADWVKAARRISPQVLTDLLEITGKMYYEHLQTLDSEADAIFSVAWAGEDISTNRFHIAREYTEKWHHQQQIRRAVGKEQILLESEYYFPFLETSFRALPHHYREIQADNHTVIRFVVPSVGYRCDLVRVSGKWTLTDTSEIKPDCEVSIPDPIAWRILTKGISQEEALQQVSLSGETALGMPVVGMLAVMG